MLNSPENASLLHIVGIVGLPARYGGFETLVDNLLESETLVSRGVVVYCGSDHRTAGGSYKGASLYRLPFKANGWQSIIYDALGIVLGSLRGRVVLILGTSGTAILPLMRLLFHRTRYVVNMGGIEWRRSKWGLLARLVLRLNEWAAARHAHLLIVDNEGLVEYVRGRYHIQARFIPYGGDQYLVHEADSSVFAEWGLPRTGYDLAVARAQPDNNLRMILDAYSETTSTLVFVSNWDTSSFGRTLRAQYAGHPRLFLVGPIYSLSQMKALQVGARLYVHGHSAGGTNPSLVEAMWAGLPIAAYDVGFNRHTTGNLATYFRSKEELTSLLAEKPVLARSAGQGERLAALARRKFAWSQVRSDYWAVVSEQAAPLETS